MGDDANSSEYPSFAFKFQQ